MGSQAYFQKKSSLQGKWFKHAYGRDPYADLALLHDSVTIGFVDEIGHQTPISNGYNHNVMTYFSIASVKLHMLFYNLPAIWHCSMIAVLVLGCIFLRLAYRQREAQITPFPHIDDAYRHFVIGISTSAVLAYALLATLLYQVWLAGDSWWLQMMNEACLSQKLNESIVRYTRWCSRIGEQIGVWFSLSHSRWEFYILTPLFVTVFPFAVYRLVGKGSIFSTNGLASYWCCFILSLLGVAIYPRWRNYHCFFAHITYLWPTIWSIFFLSFHRKNIDYSGWKGNALCSFLFVLGVMSGWSTECISICITPMVTALCLYRLYNEKLAKSCAWGCVGLWLGFALLFSSGALSSRASDPVHTVLFGKEPDFISHYVHNLTQQSVDALRGGAIPVNLVDVPLLDHIYFAPYLLKSFSSACLLPSLCIICLMGIMAFSKGSHKWRQIGIALGGVVFALLMALSYLVGGIPNPYSFLPSCFFLICVAVYMLSRLKAWQSLAICIALLAYGLPILLFSIIEGMQYKKYEVQRHETIMAQVFAGKSDIVLPAPYSLPPLDPLHIITEEDLKPAADHIHNQKAVWGLRQLYGVETISQAKPNQPPASDRHDNPWLHFIYSHPLFFK